MDEDDNAFEAQLAKIRENAYSKKGKGTDLFNKRLSRLQEGLKGSGSSRVPGRGSNGYSDIDDALTWAERDEGFLDDIEVHLLRLFFRPSVFVLTLSLVLGYFGR